MEISGEIRVNRGPFPVKFITIIEPMYLRRTDDLIHQQPSHITLPYSLIIIDGVHAKLLSLQVILRIVIN